MRATDIIVGGKLFPVHLSCSASNRVIAMLMEISTSPGVTLPSSSLGLGRDKVTHYCPGKSDVLRVFMG